MSENVSSLLELAVQTGKEPAFRTLMTEIQPIAARDALYHLVMTE